MRLQTLRFILSDFTKILWNHLFWNVVRNKLEVSLESTGSHEETNRATEITAENVSKNVKTSVILDNIFVTIKLK